VRIADARDARLVRAPSHGVFPTGFYVTTNRATQVRVRGRWRRVARIEMDCGVVVNRARGLAVAAPFHRVRRGDWVVAGEHGVRTAPQDAPGRDDAFRFMTSPVSTEKPRGRELAAVARAMRRTRREGRGILLVAGPAVVHTGGATFLARLIDAGYAQALFAGNGLATHDIEAALFGTALGVPLEPGAGRPGPDGHAHHLRAINAIRARGGIANAVQTGLLTKGIMYACVRNHVPYVLAGSIRDDGPLPDVITDTVDAQDAMRALVPGIGLALCIGSTLHAVATGNLLPAVVPVICVDINPAAVTKLDDRGTRQGIGIISDAASFLRELCACLGMRGA